MKKTRWRAEGVRGHYKKQLENLDLIISLATTLGELSDQERYYIEFYNTLTPLGYNHNRGGSVPAGGEVFEFNGEFYLGMADLADYYDIYEETLRKRVAASWTLQ